MNRFGERHEPTSPAKRARLDPRVVVHPTQQWETAGSALEHLPDTPIRGLLVGPSGCGKSTVLLDIILRLYRGAFERIYVFSPSVNIDSAWTPVKEYVEKEMRVDQQREKCFFDTFDHAALARIVETQKRVTEESKRQKLPRLYGICIVCDDFADDTTVMQARGGYSVGGSMLNTLFIRGRHMMISTLVSTQKLRLINQTIRVNAQFILCWRLRNALELDAIIEELSAVYSKKQLLEMYEVATAEPYSFWYINLTSKTREEMFWLRFEKRMVPIKRDSSVNGSAGGGGGELVEQQPTAAITDRG